MNTEILGVILQWVALVALCYPLGRYIAKVYKGERTWLDFMAPVEKWIYKVCGIRPDQEMNWKQFLKALLTVNLFWFVWGMVLLVCQGWLPLNPDGNAGQSPDLAFNTCISFMVNCNLQHYSGESGLSYFTQLFDRDDGCRRALADNLFGTFERFYRLFAIERHRGSIYNQKDTYEQ